MISGNFTNFQEESHLTPEDERVIPSDPSEIQQESEIIP